MFRTLAEIAKLVNGELRGDGNIQITGVADIKLAKPGDITFLANPKYNALAEKTAASAVIVARQIEIKGIPSILVDNPTRAFAQVTTLFYGKAEHSLKGIHPSAVIADNAQIGKNVAIGPYVVIGQRSRIGDDSIIYAGSYIGDDVDIGNNCLIYSRVTICNRVKIGQRVIVHAGTVIGAEGFGYLSIGGKQERIPHFGDVIIGDDVEIGVNATIDRAKLDSTVIGRGTKIDNLVHIAHNVVVGENSLIVAQVGVSGSVRIGNNVILAGQVGIADHVSIGDGAVVLSRSGVTKDIRSGETVYGFPAKPQAVAKKVNAHLQRLPKYVEELRILKNRVESLENKTKRAGSS